MIVGRNFEGTQAEADELRDMLEAIANEHYVDPTRKARTPMREFQVATCNEEMFTVRDAMRELNRIIGRIEDGDIEKAILTKHGQMVAAVVPLAYLYSRGNTNELGYRHLSDDPNAMTGGTRLEPKGSENTDG